jgi:hypothetical protein
MCTVRPRRLRASGSFHLSLGSAHDRALRGDDLAQVRQPLLGLLTPADRHAVAEPQIRVHRLERHRVAHVLGRELLLVADALVPQLCDERLDRVLVARLQFLDHVLKLD